MATLKARYQGDIRSIDAKPLLIVERPGLSVTTEQVSMRELFGEPHGPIQWDHPKRKTGSSRFHKYLREETSGIRGGELARFTEFVVEGVRFIRQTESMGFVVGGLTTNGKPKSLNWPRLAANVTATQANFTFQVFAATSIPLPTEYSFVVRGLTKEDWAVHWDHNVAALGGVKIDLESNSLTLFERPSKPAYLLVTKGWNESWGTRREIQMAQEVNAAARLAGEDEPRIVLLDLDYNIRGLNNLKAYLIYNTAFAGALVRMVRDMVATSDVHPHFNSFIRSDLEKFRDGLPPIKEQFHQVAEVAQELRGSTRREVTEDHYRMRQIHKRATQLHMVGEELDRGVLQALARVT